MATTFSIHSRLQVEANDRENGGNFPAVSDQRRVIKFLCGR